MCPARRIDRGERVSSSHECLIALSHCLYLARQLALTPVDCCAPSRAPRRTRRRRKSSTQSTVVPLVVPRDPRARLAPQHRTRNPRPANSDYTSPRPRSTVSSRPSLPLRFCRSRPALAQSPRLHVQGNVLSRLRPMLNGLCEVEDPAGHPLLVCADPAREFPTRLHGIVSIEH